MSIPADHTDRLFAKPKQGTVPHTLHPLPDHRYECAWCAAFGYHYLATGEVFAYSTCIHRAGHVWVYEGTRLIEVYGTGVRVFRSGEDTADFAYVTHPQARAWAQGNAEAVAALTSAVTEAVPGASREALAVTAWAAATSYPGDSDQQLREVHFQVMARRDGPYDREMSEALDRVLTVHLPLPATSVPAGAEPALEAAYLRAGDGWDGALQPVTWDPRMLKFRPVAWQCGHQHPDGAGARECAQAELLRRRGVTDPDQVLSEITAILAVGVPETPLAAYDALARVGVLFGELDRSLHQWGRFPRRWVSGRWMLDGERRWKLSRKPGSGPKNLRAILEFAPGEAEGVPCLVVPDGEYAVDTVERLNSVYQTGRQEAWNERA